MKAKVPIPDDTLQGMFVKAYIENGVQVHLEVCSVFVTRSSRISPRIWLCLRG